MGPMNKNSEASFRSFSGTNGETEHFIFIKAPEGAAFGDQLEAVEEGYAGALAALGLAPGTAVFRRIFLSDALNQAALVRPHDLYAATPGSPVSVSVVQQTPLPAAKIALLAYHVRGRAPLLKQRLSPNHILVEKNGLRHLWSTSLCAGAGDGASSSKEQTLGTFGKLVETLAGQGGTLRDHCVRTWVYLKSVDVSYQGMAEARRELFAREGLAGDTHYIAGTCIEGACAHQFDLVSMDAYSILGLKPRQVSYLNAFDRLCPAKDYGITFERGARIAYADRVHYFISGTASIDNNGAIMHPGDVLLQLARTFENIDSLLNSGKAALADMMYMIVYLRDPADFPRVSGYIRENFPGMPVAIVQGAVCRPGWLVEVEGVAAVNNDDPSLPSF